MTDSDIDREIDKKLQEIAEREYKENKKKPLQFVDERRNPIPLDIAKEILSRYSIITLNDNEQMLYYNDGIYHLQSNSLIKKETQKRVPWIKRNEKNEVIDTIKGLTYINRDKLNADIFDIALENKVYNIKKDEFRDHSPDNLLTVQIPIIYNENSDCPNIKKFLSEVLDPSNIPVIQELFGYCLYRDYPIQKAIMFIGEGANGKSVLLNLIKNFLGKENVSSIPLQSLDKNRFAAAQLYEKLANIYPDISNRALYDTGVFKMMVGGDMITAEQKFRDGFNFTNYAKLMFSCNQLPETYDNSKAYFRRWIIIDFPNTFTGKDANKNLIYELTTKEELSGLFNWAIEGLKRLLKNGEFTNSSAMEEIEKIYKMKSSPLSAFVDSELKIELGEYITKDELYEKFQDFCENNGLDILQKQEVGKKLPQLISKVRTERIRINGKLTYIWKNLKLATKPETAILAPESTKKQGTAKCSRCSMENTTFNQWSNYNYIKDKNIIEHLEQLEQQKYTKESLLKSLEEEGIVGERAEKTIELWLKKGIIYEFKPNQFKFSKQEVNDGNK